MRAMQICNFKKSLVSRFHDPSADAGGEQKSSCNFNRRNFKQSVELYKLATLNQFTEPVACRKEDFLGHDTSKYFRLHKKRFRNLNQLSFSPDDLKKEEEFRDTVDYVKSINSNYDLLGFMKFAPHRQKK